MKRVLLAGLMVTALSFSTSASANTVYTDLLSANLATNGTSITVNGAKFTVAPTNIGAGTGSLNSFLRLQQPDANNPFEKGYNTNDRSYQGNKPEYDQKGDTNFTRAVLLGDLPTVTVAGTEYFELIFDMFENQSGTVDPLLSMHELELYGKAATGLSSDGNAKDYGLDPANLGTKVWELDFVGLNNQIMDNRIELDSQILGGGQGKYDIVALFETSLFSGFAGTDYFYLYNELGGIANSTPADYPAEATFEEWAYFDNALTPGDPGGGGPGSGTPVPEPSTIILLGSGLLGLAFWGRRKK